MAFLNACRLLLVVGSFFCSHLALADSFIFRMNLMPVVQGKTCDDFAFEEGQRFQGSLHDDLGRDDVQVTDARCDDSVPTFGERSWSVVITYEAASKLNVISTQDSYAPTGTGYATRALCEGALASEREMFERLTGLGSFFSYCRVPQTSRGGLWSLSIGGFGEAEVKPFSTTAVLSGPVFSYSERDLMGTIRDQMASLGYTVSQIQLQKLPYQQNLSIRAYGRSRLDIEESLMAKYDTKESCDADLQLARQALVNAQVTHLATYCHGIHVGGQVELASLTDRLNGISFAKPEARYQTFAECQAAKAAVEAHYSTNLGRDIKGTFCSAVPVNRGYQVIMIEMRP
jgi:hypothetical protein